MHPIFSVIIPTTCNRHALLLEAISSVSQQTFQNYEIIIVKARNRKLSLPIWTDKLNLRIIPTEENLNASQARNKGAMKASGEWLAFLDDDDLWDKKYLEEIFNELCKEEYDFLIGTLFELEGNKIIKQLTRPFKLNDLFLFNPGITGSNLVVNKIKFIGMNGFAEDLTVSQDKSIVIELLKLNFKYKIIVDAQAYNRDHELVRLTDIQSQLNGYVEFYLFYRREMSFEVQKLLIKKILSYMKLNFLKSFFPFKLMYYKKLLTFFYFCLNFLVKKYLKVFIIYVI
jgi:glycosyltransferase involved in cell wall biosynthesis